MQVPHVLGDETRWFTKQKASFPYTDLLKSRQAFSGFVCTAFFPECLVSSNCVFNIFKACFLGTEDQENQEGLYSAKYYSKKKFPQGDQMVSRQVNTSASGLLILSCGSVKSTGHCQLSTHTTVQKHLGEIALSLLTMKTRRWTLTYLLSHVHGWKNKNTQTIHERSFSPFLYYVTECP